MYAQLRIRSKDRDYSAATWAAYQDKTRFMRMSDNDESEREALFVAAENARLAAGSGSARKYETAVSADSYPLPGLGAVAHEDSEPDKTSEYSAEDSDRSEAESDCSDPDEESDCESCERSEPEGSDDGMAGDDASDISSIESSDNGRDLVKDIVNGIKNSGNGPEEVKIPIIRSIEYDLSKIAQFDDPRHLFEEIAALKE